MKKTLKLASLVTIFSFIFTTVVSAQTLYKPISSRTDDAFMFGWVGIVICFATISFVFDIVVAYIVYNDAVKNNIDNAIIWALISFFFPLIGILVYFLAIKPGATNSGSTQISDKPVVTEIDTVSEPVELIKDNKKKKSVRKANK